MAVPKAAGSQVRQGRGTVRTLPPFQGIPCRCLHRTQIGPYSPEPGPKEDAQLWGLQKGTTTTVPGGRKCKAGRTSPKKVQTPTFKVEPGREGH